MIAPYLLRPIIVLGLLALAAGPASTLVNLRRAEFSAETMVHGVFPGIVVGMAVGVLLVVGYLIVPGAFGRLLAAGTRSMAVLSGACALLGGWAGFSVALVRVPRPLSPQACVALGVLACFAFACALRQLREVRMGRDEASAGSQGTLTARETVRETGDRVGDNAASVRETARETRSSDLLALGEAS